MSSAASSSVRPGRAGRIVSRVLAGCLALACAMAVLQASAAPQRKKPVPPPPPVLPGMQLGNAVRPLAYEAELTIVPSQEKFAGRLVVHVELAGATEFFWINATRLDIRTATVVAGGKSFAAKVVPGNRDVVGLRFASPVPAGRAVVTFEYDGAIDRGDTVGVFRQQDGDAWYAFTQFEATDARRAFPCFDEPQWKTPWHLTLVVPSADVAVANMPVVAEERVAPVEAAPAKKGAPPPAPGPAMKRVRFAPTPPLPSYLVAFAVGPFDVVDGGRAGRKGTPLRYIVPKGRAAEAQYAKEATPKLVDLLEDYFGQPYPYPKLDSVAVPIPSGLGAMENVGLVTYDLPLILSRPDQETEGFRRTYASVAAHEIAHQWFGDLVTMLWWNDVWLNESFATWMAAKTVERFMPAWQTRLTADERRRQAIDVDRLPSTRQVRQPVVSQDDVNNAFDRISYEKGAAVLSMFEASVGEERFRNGVRRYLHDHANGNARAEDFYAAIAAEAGTDGAAVVAGMKSFVEQPGVPRVSVLLDCGPDGQAPPRINLAQSRFAPAAAARPASDPSPAQRWTFPACFQFGRGGDFDEICATVQEPRTAVVLPQGERCPQWVLPNRGGVGYFVPVLPVELMQQLTRTPLLASEAIPVLHDAAILVASGDWPADLALDFAARYVNHRQLPVAQAALDLAKSIRWSWLTEPGDREAFARYVQKTFGARARAFGWLPRSSDREGDAIHREALVPWVADRGNDAALQREATRLAREWLGGKGPLPAGAEPALITAARIAQGSTGKELVDAMLDSLNRLGPNDRIAVLTALGSVRDKVLADALYDALLEKDGRAALTAMQYGAAGDDAAALVAVRYLRAHYDAAARRMPESGERWLPRVGGQVCDTAGKADFDAAFAERAPKVPGGARNLAQADERIAICTASRQTQRTALRNALSKQ